MPETSRVVRGRIESREFRHAPTRTPAKGANEDDHELHAGCKENEQEMLEPKRSDGPAQVAKKATGGQEESVTQRLKKIRNSNN